MRNERLARALLRLYPRAWRERYEDEYVALLVESPLTPGVLLDVLASAIVERLTNSEVIFAVAMLMMPIVIALAAIPAASQLAAEGLPGGDSGLSLIVVGLAALGRRIYGFLRINDDQWSGIGGTELVLWHVAFFIAAVQAAWPGPSALGVWTLGRYVFYALPFLYPYTRSALVQMRRALDRRLRERMSIFHLSS